MKTIIWASYDYGAYSICYQKIILLPFTPFYGLVIDDETKGVEIGLELRPEITTIHYDIIDKVFSVFYREIWRVGIAINPDVIDKIIKDFTKAGWECVKNDSEIMKELMGKYVNQ